MTASERKGPLTDIRVIELGQLIAGPFCGQLMADMGADLIKVEPPGQGDPMRVWGRGEYALWWFRPGTMERWGLGYDDLVKDNPGLIMIRVSGYGQSGPYSSRAGYASVGEAMGGMRHLCGEPDRPPSRAGLSIGDTLAASYACMGACVDLRVSAERDGGDHSRIHR
jgi:crotonobetainyl-CoA:carnitine CoA-transferase CaiB-like acyl-CoA transferase